MWAGVLDSKREENRRTPCWVPHGSQRGDVEIRTTFRDSAGPRSLVFDLSIAHDRFGSSSHVLQNGLLTHPQDLDGPLRVAAQRKSNAYGQQYAGNQNISFLPAIVSTYMSFCVLFFYRPTWRPRRTSLPLEYHRKTTNWTRSVSSAQHSISYSRARSDWQPPKRRR